MTAAGLVTAALFFFLSQSKPMLNIAPYAPPSSVFSKSIITSIIGQFLIHFCSLILALKLAEKYDMYGVDLSSASGSQSRYAARVLSRHLHRRISVPDEKFSPNLMNSTVYLLCVATQISNFVVNYRGEPFTQNIQDNPLLYRSVQAMYAILALVVSGVFEPLNDMLQLEAFPCSEYQIMLACLLAFDFGACWFIEKKCQTLEVSSPRQK